MARELERAFARVVREKLDQKTQELVKNNDLGGALISAYLSNEFRKEE